MNSGRNILRTIEPIKVTVGDVDFAIYPFQAFKAANISGEIMGLLVPMLGALVPLFNKEDDVLDTDIENAAPAIAGAFNSLNGDKVELLLRKLLTDHSNIVTEIEDSEGNVKQIYLTEEVINTYGLFCGDVQEMYILAFHVLKVNYKGFFGKIGNLSGTLNVSTKIQKMMQNTVS